MSDTAERQAALERTLKETEGQTPAEQARAIQAYLVAEPSQDTADRLWAWLVGGLLALVGLALAGLIFLLLTDNYHDVILTVFIALLSGLLGLFVKSPGAQQPPV